MLCREVKSDDDNKFVGGFNLAVTMKEDLDVPTEGGVMMWSTSDAIHRLSLQMWRRRSLLFSTFEQ